MRLKQVTLAAVLVVTLFSCASLAQQVTAKGKTPQEEAVMLWLEIHTTEAQAKLYAIAPESNKDNAGAAEKLAGLYRKAVLLPSLSDQLASNIWSDFTENRFAANSAPQVSQVASEASVKYQFLLAAQNGVLIEQNKRIIDLLEQIARKK